MRDAVFISYSHRDSEWLDRLNVHLRPLVRENALKIWDDTKIAAGTIWREEIATALESAKVAILLISADFLASDFVSDVEIPSLLSAAQSDGAVILPLIISPSRFTNTPALSQFQAVNNPGAALISLSRAEQEGILVRLSEVVEKAMTNVQVAVATPEPFQSQNKATPLDRLPLKDCLERLGSSKDLIPREDEFIRNWLGQRLTEGRWRSEGPDVSTYLKEIGEPEQVQTAVLEFVQHVIACYAPTHNRVSSLYVSTRKVTEALRLLRREGEAVTFSEADDPIENLINVHQRLLITNRLTFLPARLLLGGDLPTNNDEVCYFAGSFTLDVDENEVLRVPGAAEALLEKKTRSMYGVVSNVFQNPDPFAYPLLRFTGHLGSFAVTAVLSRKYIHFSSMTASFLADAVEGASLQIQGIATMRRAESIHEIHPLACGSTYF